MRCIQKLTKNELRLQKDRLEKFDAYLPTIKLKKVLLQQKLLEAKLFLAEKRVVKLSEVSQNFKSNRVSLSFVSDIDDHIEIVSKVIDSENVGGVLIPRFVNLVSYAKKDLDLVGTGSSINLLIKDYSDLLVAKEEMLVALERFQVLERELYRVSIRANFMEKILIPKTKTIVRKIEIFLSDVRIASVGGTKLAKKKMRGRS